MYFHNTNVNLNLIMQTAFDLDGAVILSVTNSGKLIGTHILIAEQVLYVKL